MSKRAVRVGVLGVVVAIGGMVACGGSSSGKEITIASSANPANVVIDLRDDSGTHIGSCSGILITSSTVLTAGHCVVKATQFVVSTVGGKQTANGALTYTTWQDFESNWSHPQHSDIGVIVLDQAIFLAQYPTLATALLTDGTRLSRVRRVDPDVIDATAQFEEVSAPIILGQEKGFPLAYGVDPSLAEVETDTGGALYDSASNIVYGVVSGKGMSTGRFYVSRVDYLADWISQIGKCEPAPRTEQCHPSGSSSGSGSGSGSGGSSSSSSGCSGSGSGSSSSGSSNGSS
ncbi:MAG TPA: trypsin-like serine protease, partial [Polyangiaceae bacterium]